MRSKDSITFASIKGFTVVFQFKNFSLQHGNCAHKIGTDSMVLGALVQMDAFPESILDIGSGSGVLAFMMAQKFPGVPVTAIEPDHDSFQDLQHNVNEHHYPIYPLNKTLQNFESKTTYDVIVCNPPYFQTTYPNPDARKSAARHDGQSLSLQELFAFVQIKLSDHGIFWMIGPAEVRIPQHDLQKASICTLLNDKGDAVRSILGFAKQPVERIKTSSLVIRNNGEYTVEYKELTKEFHGVQLR